MNTLYININGENKQSTENITVVGKQEDAIINKFYFELAKGIVNGVAVLGIGEVKKKGLVTDFEAINKEAFAKITEQWKIVKQILLGENPSGTQTVTFPNEYIDWLKYHSNPIYNEIAKSLASRGNAVEINIGNIYRNGLLLLVNNIDTDKEYGCFVVSDEFIDDDSAIAVAIRGKIGKDVPVVPFVEIVEEKDKRYDEIRSFHEKMAIVRKGDKYGFVNSQGEEVVACKYDTVSEFHENMATVKKNGRWGFVNNDGEEVIECKYYYASDYHEGLASVSIDGKNEFFVDKSGRIVLDLSNSPFYVDCENGFCNGLCMVTDSKSEMRGFIDKTGHLVIDCIYEDAHPFHAGLALVWLKGWNYGFDDETEMEFINRNGETIIEGLCRATDFDEDFRWAAVQKHDFSSEDIEDMITEIVNCEGKVLFGYEKGSFYADSVAPSYEEDLFKHGVLCGWDGHGSIFEHRNYMWYDIKRHVEGKLDLEANHYWLWNGCFDEKGLLLIGKKNITDHYDWGFIDVYGDVAIDFQFAGANLFSEGLAAVAKDGLWGYIDVKGNIVIPYKYSKAEDFSEGRAVVEKDGVIMVIDKEGNRIV